MQLPDNQFLLVAGALSQNLWARQSALWNQLSPVILGEVCPTGPWDELTWEDSGEIFEWKRSSGFSNRL